MRLVSCSRISVRTTPHPARWQTCSGGVLLSPRRHFLSPVHHDTKTPPAPSGPDTRPHRTTCASRSIWKLGAFTIRRPAVTVRFTEDAESFGYGTTYPLLVVPLPVLTCRDVKPSTLPAQKTVMTGRLVQVDALPAKGDVEVFSENRPAFRLGLVTTGHTPRRQT